MSDRENRLLSLQSPFSLRDASAVLGGDNASSLRQIHSLVLAGKLSKEYRIHCTTHDCVQKVIAATDDVDKLPTEVQCEKCGCAVGSDPKNVTVVYHKNDAAPKRNC